MAAPTTGTCKHRSQSASASTSFFVVPKLRGLAIRRAGSLCVARQAASRSVGSATKPRIIRTPEVLALSPERGAVSRIVAAVPERIQGRQRPGT